MASPKIEWRAGQVGAKGNAFEFPRQVLPIDHAIDWE